MQVCNTCPSFLPRDEAEKKYGQPIEAPMCRKYGYVLSRPDQSREQQLESMSWFAMNCDSYGEKFVSSTPVSFSPRIAEPDQRLIEAGGTGQKTGACTACKNCVCADSIHANFGWGTAACRVKGTMIFDAIKEARDCPWAAPGAADRVAESLQLLDAFEDNFSITEKLNYEKLSVAPEDPQSYVSDDPVEDVDASEGIRAWRRIECPLGTGKHTFLPIFDSSENGPFTEHERKRIPQSGDSNHPELYVDYGNLVWRFAVDTWNLGETLLIQSEPGLGKTQLAYHLGWLMQIPVTRIFFQPSTEWDDVFGKVGFGGGETYWADGRFTSAFQRPGIILIDEPNMASGDIIASLRTTTESDATLYIDAAYGKSEEDRLKLEIKPHHYNFRMWCSNPAWDPRNIGVNELAAADISRLSPAVLTFPPKEVEKHIIKSTLLELDNFEISDQDLKDLLLVSEDIREASSNGDFPSSWGIRENVKVARKLQWYPFIEAFRMTKLNYFDPETVEFIIKSSIDTVRGGESF